MNSNPLVPIWEAYLVVVEGLRVSKRVVNFSLNATEALNALDGSENEMIRQVTFEKHKLGLNLLNRCKKINQVSEMTLQYSSGEVEDLFVLSLWASFERYLRDFFQEKGEKIQEILPYDLADVYYEHLYKEIEYWKPAEILSILKRSLFKNNQQLIELAEDVLKYRNWVAHGRNPDNPAPVNVTSPMAYSRLDAIINILIANQ